MRLLIYILTANLPKNLPVKNFFNRLRFDRIMVMSLWPHFFWPTLYMLRSNGKQSGESMQQGEEQEGYSGKDL